MVIALLTVLGIEFELVLRRKAPPLPSNPPFRGPTVVKTTGVALSDNVVSLPSRRSA